MSIQGNIPGIHNWCDRWCEKCPFIARCAVGEHELEIIEQEQKGFNPYFWEDINQQFTKSKELLEELAKEKGIDLKGISDEEWENIDKGNRKQQLDAESHPISRMASQYAKECERIVNLDFIENLYDSEEKKIDLGLEDNVYKNISKFKETIDVIRWYMFFIPAKCNGLMMENMDAEFEDSEFPPEERSYNGTAKITLISIERSIAAWGFLLQLLPDMQDAILSELALLQKLHRSIKNEFPDAMRFIRPGFDD